MNAKMASLAGMVLLGMASAASAQTFSNPAALTLPGAGSGASTGAPASVYPSDISVIGMGAGPWDIDVTLTGLSHTFPDDLDVLLIGPSGSVMLMSDVGGGTDIVGVNFTFSDGSPAMADAAANATGIYAPTNFGVTDAFPAPAPAGPYGTSLNTLGAGAVNGTWSLYIVDDLGGDIGTLAGGWSITFSPIPAPGALALLGLAGLVGSRRRRLG